MCKILVLRLKTYDGRFEISVSKLKIQDLKRMIYFSVFDSALITIDILKTQDLCLENQYSVPKT